MGEEIIRIQIAELSTVRMKRRDNSVIESPIEMLEIHAPTATKHHETIIHLEQLQKAIFFLTHKAPDVQVEFTISINKEANKSTTKI